MAKPMNGKIRFQPVRTLPIMIWCLVAGLLSKKIAGIRLPHISPPPASFALHFGEKINLALIHLNYLKIVSPPVII